MENGIICEQKGADQHEGTENEYRKKNKLSMCFSSGKKKRKKKWSICSDTGNRTPSCRVRDGDVNHYTISDFVE